MATDQDPKQSSATAERTLLALNGGSSSIKFALYAVERLEERLSGNLDRSKNKGGKLSVLEVLEGRRSEHELACSDRQRVVDLLIDWLQARGFASGIEAIGHRVVHGMHHREPERVTPALLDELRRLAAFDPDHLPAEIDMVEAVARRFPASPQVVSFDTAFHRRLAAGGSATAHSTPLR